METQLQALKEILTEIADLQGIASVLEWEQQTYMPSGGAQDRGDQLSTLARLMHQRWTSDEMVRLVDDLSGTAASLDPDSNDVAIIRFAHHEVQKRTRVPARLVAEYSQVTSVSQEAWVRARKESNFSAIQPYLERIIDLRRQYASHFAPYDHVYDPLLDDYERGMKTADVQRIFQALRPQQVELIKAIAARPQVDDSFLYLDYPEQDQWDFGVEVITCFGYDWNRGRQDRAAHPFSITFGIDDVRITTRFSLNQLSSGLFSTMHEAGHALYEQGVDRSLRRTPLAGGASMALHESQSRMWENLVGRSLPFWSHFYPALQKRFPAQLGSVDLLTFYRAINKAQPSLIRTEADEATYNLHIMLRLELEIALMEGSLAVRDLPEAWNARMRDYLGLTPPDDADGVLQDVHWPAGLIGYFPTYALGNLVSVQLWERIHADLPGLDAQIEKGEFSALLGWLREKVHSHGSKFDSKTLVERVTGSPIDPAPYVRYLQAKYKEIYNL